jgi:gluconolactonase
VKAHVKTRRGAEWLATLLALALALGGAAQGAEPEVISRAIRSPEGPIFVDGTLYLVDYAGHDVVRLTENSAKVIWHRDGCGPTGLAHVPEGLLVACFDGKQVATISLDGRTLSIVENDETGQRLREPNDFASDGRGGVYFSGTGPWEPRPIVGKIYYRSADRRVRTVASDLHSPNGLVLSPDGRLLYVAESFASRILLFNVAADGSLSERREFLKLSEVLPGAGGRTYTPDGLRIDRQGNLFVGFWDGACFAVISPDGKLIKQIDLPAPHDPNLAITPDGRSVILTGVFDLPDNGSRGELYRVPNPVAPRTR